MTATGRAGAASFAVRCGVHDTRRAMDADALLRRLRDEGIEQVRIAWCDLHGVLRGKTLMPHAVADALRDAYQAIGLHGVAVRQGPANLVACDGERICAALDCQPGDLLEYRSGPEALGKLYVPTSGGAQAIWARP